MTRSATDASMRACNADRISYGEEYIRQITALQSDRLARSAFQSLVRGLVPTGGALFDFGSGTGMDARLFAEHGYRVSAYDADPNMCEFFARHCANLIDAGRVSLDRRSYRDFLSHPRPADSRRIDMVTANFAPLNLIDDLHELFAAFDVLTGPEGRVLASVLSPLYSGDWKYTWWWRNALRLWHAGRFSVRGAHGPIVRRRIGDFAAQGQPFFTLKRVYRGLPPRGPRDSAGIDVSKKSLSADMRLCGCQFMFLLFEKPGGRTDSGRGD